MQNLFDYFFFRIYRFFKEKGDNVPETKGVLILSLMQFFTLLDFMVFILLFYEFPIPNKYYFLPLIILIGWMNWHRYDTSGFDLGKLEQKWANESTSERLVRGWLVTCYLVMSFLIVGVYGYLKHNLKAI